MGIKVEPQAVSRNVELGTSQIIAGPPTVTGTGFVAIAGLSVTVVVGSRPVDIHVHIPQIINALATAGGMYVAVFRDGTEIAEVANLLPTIQFAGTGASIFARDAPAAGSHTYDVRARIGTSGQQGIIIANATGPARISVIEA